MKGHDKNTVVRIAFLELLSITPLAIILGNIVPPFPLKAHFFVMGAIFLCATWLLLIDHYKKWLVYISVIYAILQITLVYWNIKSFIDFFFGPFVFVLLLDILVNERVPKVLLKRYEKRFFSLLLIPIGLAVLQFFDLFPITFWNATYINYSFSADGMAVARPNGLLYHGSELSILICYLALAQYFKKESITILAILALIAVAFMTYYKALAGCIILIFLVYIAFINRGIFGRIKLLSRKRIFHYSILVSIPVLFILFNIAQANHFYTGYYFRPQLLTGRGSIWNIYLDGIKDFSFWNYLFGSGMGSSFELFKTYASPSNWYLLTVNNELKEVYGPHNTFLSLFLSSGIVGISVLVFIFKMLYTQIKTWGNSPKWNKTVFTAFILTPLFTIGITIPIFDMAVAWPCIGFLIYRWYFYCEEKKEVNA